MSEEQKKIIEELEKVRLELFRLTANLDGRIDSVNRMLDTNSTDEYKKLFVANARENRNAAIRVFNWSELEKKEQELWQKLLETF